ncbi:MAG: divalent-cation tolerance protein CutA [Planctomycetota bacterium]
MSSDESVSVIYCTCPPAEASRLARELVQARHAACVNILPGVTSVYRWEGNVEEDAESLLVIKTARGRVAELTAFLTALHPYEVPEVIAIDVVAGSEKYLSWVRGEVATGSN